MDGVGPYAPQARPRRRRSAAQRLTEGEGLHRLDPLTKKERYLVETVPAGPNAAREAEKVRTWLLSQLDERRSSRTRATVELLDKWLDVVELEATTRRTRVQVGQACAASVWAASC